MTLTELKYIVALANTKHFGKAAELCYVSQPTLSVGVKKLEEKLGVAIFERRKTAVDITPGGEEIVARARDIIERVEDLKDFAESQRNPYASPVRLAAIYTIGPYLFPRLVPAMHQQAPQLPLFIEENLTGRLRSMLVDGRLDMIIISLPFTEPDVVVKPLYEETFEVLLPIDHPWAKEESIDPNWLPDSNLLLLGDGHCFRDQVLELCPALNEKGKTFAEGSSLETLRHMVASGLGITVLPKSAALSARYSDGLVTTRPFSKPPKRTVALAWRASFPRPQLIDLVEAALTPVVQDFGYGDH